MNKSLTNKLIRFFKRIKTIRNESKKSYFFILHDYLSLKYKDKRSLSFFEYYLYGIYSKNREYKDSFLFMKEKLIFLNILNPKKYFIIARNKYLSHLIFKSHGIPSASLYLYYDPNLNENDKDFAKNYDGVLSILKRKEVKSFVVKQPEGFHGCGVEVFVNVDFSETECELTHSNGSIIELKNLLADKQLIFESLIQQTDQIKTFNPTSLNTLRFMTAAYPDGTAKLIACFIKIGRAGAYVDNAGDGGNVDAEVDINTGKIHNVIEYNGFKNIIKTEKHPDNHVQIENEIIENWDNIKTKVIEFQQKFTFLKAIGWDIALTKEGPVVVEMNDMWDETGQLFLDKGWRFEIQDCYNAWTQ